MPNTPRRSFFGLVSPVWLIARISLSRMQHFFTVLTLSCSWLHMGSTCWSVSLRDRPYFRQGESCSTFDHYTIRLYECRAARPILRFHFSYFWYEESSTLLAACICTPKSCFIDAQNFAVSVTAWATIIPVLLKS